MVELGKDPRWGVRWGVGGNSATTKEQQSAASPWASIASIAMGFERARNLGAQTKLGVVLPYDMYKGSWICHSPFLFLLSFLCSLHFPISLQSRWRPPEQMGDGGGRSRWRLLRTRGLWEVDCRAISCFVAIASLSCS